VAGIVFDSLDYDASDPDRADADIVSYAAGHKTLGLYSMWALRNEVMRIGCPELLPQNQKHQLRLEICSVSAEPITKTPLFLKYQVKPLDGHPTPATPFLRLSTGASGSESRPRWAWPSAPWIITEATHRACISSKGRAG